MGRDKRQRQQAILIGATLGAIGLHGLLWLVMRPDPDFPLPLIQPGRAIQVTLISPEPRPDARDATPRTAATREAVAPKPDPTSLPPVQSLGPEAPRPRSVVALPSAPGSVAPPGANWTVTEPAETAMRKALRRSVGCDYGLKLTRVEQEACDERFGRNRLKESAPTRLTADKRRARELEGEADYRMKRREWKEAPPPVGTFNDLRDMGGQPPARPK